MKKQYIEPLTIVVALSGEGLLVDSSNVHFDQNGGGTGSVDLSGNGTTDTPLVRDWHGCMNEENEW